MNTAIRHSAGRRGVANKSRTGPPQSAALRRLVTCCAFFGALVGTGSLADALTLHNALVAGILLLVVGVIQVIRPRRRPEATVANVGAQAVAGAFVRGGLTGVAFAAAMAAILPLVALIPTPSTWADWDRPRIEERVDTLAAAGNFEAAANVIEKRLADSMSDQWRHLLQERHVDLVIAAGDASDGVDAKAAHWRRAVDLAQTYHADDRLPQALLSSIAAAAASERAQADKVRAVAELASRHQEGLRKLIALFTGIGQPAALDAVLRTIEKYVPKNLWPENLPQLLIDNLLRWAEVTGSLVKKRERLEVAVAECRRRGLDPKLAEGQLAAVQKELAKLAPVVLPPGARARLVAVHSAATPAVAFDIAVESAAGQTIQDLSGKDFAVTSGGRRVAAQEVSRVLHSTAADLSVVMLLDYSASTQNVRGAAQSGAIALTSSAPRGTQFRVLAFHDEVVAVTDWTDRFAEIDSRLRAFQASGPRTSLRRAIAVAIAELAARAGARVLVIFTDGRDTTGAVVNDADLIAQCRSKGVRVIAIGLENGDLDAALLAKLAAGTGGQYFAASKQEELVEKFRALRLEQTTSVYRIAILTTPAMNWPLEIVIGGGARQLRIDVPRTTLR